MRSSLSKCKLFIQVSVILLLSENGVLGGTLAPPQSPVKVLVASGVSDPAEKIRYYSFGEEDGRGNSGNGGGGGNDRGGYASKDPFAVPTLSEIAEMMRRRDDRGGNGHGHGRNEYDDRPEHMGIDDDDRPDTGWGQPRPDSRENDRNGWSNPKPPPRDGWNSPPRPPPTPPPRDGWNSPPRPPPTPPPRDGWNSPPRPPPTPPPRDGWNSPPRPPPTPPPRDGWNSPPRPPPTEGWTTPGPPPRDSWGWENDRQGNGGKGSFTPIDNRDAYKPWQVQDDHGPHDNRHEEKGGWGWGTTTPKYNPKYLASDEDKYRPIRYPPSVTQGWSDGKAKPIENDRDRGNGWGKDDRGPPSGPGPLYLPPRRDPPQDRDRDGWGPPPPPPPNNNRGWGSEERQPERPPPKKGWGWDEPTRPPPPRPPPTSPGWGWGDDPPPRPPPTRPPPPPTRGWGWESGERDRNGNGEREDRPNPFEYRNGVDDLSKHISPDIYERDDTPPGIQRRPQEDSYEDESFPRQHNHYRIVAYTPSPEEINNFHNKKKPSQDHGQGWHSHSHSHHSSKGKDPNYNYGDKCGRNCGNGQGGSKGQSSFQPSQNEKWFNDNFEKKPDQGYKQLPALPLPQPAASITSTTPSTNANNKGNAEVTKPAGIAAAAIPILPGTATVENSKTDKTAKGLRYDAQGFKYVPYDPNPTNKRTSASSSSSQSQPRDIYAHLDNFKDSKDPYKRATLERLRGKPDSKANANGHLQGSESRNSFVRKSFSRSQISIWKTDEEKSTDKDDIDNPSPSTPTQKPIGGRRSLPIVANTIKPSNRRATTTATATTTTPKSTFPPFKKAANNSSDASKADLNDFGRKINVIRDRIKNRASRTTSKPLVREALFSNPDTQVFEFNFDDDDEGTTIIYPPFFDEEPEPRTGRNATLTT